MAVLHNRWLLSVSLVMAGCAGRELPRTAESRDTSATQPQSFLVFRRGSIPDEHVVAIRVTSHALPGTSDRMLVIKGETNDDGEARPTPWSLLVLQKEVQHNWVPTAAGIVFTWDFGDIDALESWVSPIHGRVWYDDRATQSSPVGRWLSVDLAGEVAGQPVSLVGGTAVPPEPRASEFGAWCERLAKVGQSQSGLLASVGGANRED